MYKNRTITLCLPCRNEAEHLPEIIASVPSLVDEIIVVSNCSTDDSVRVARSLGVVVIEDNRTLNGIGYGFALISGMNAATKDIVIVADADGTYPINRLRTLLKQFIDSGSDFASCSRYPAQKGSQISFALKLGVYLLNIESFLLYGVRVNDILSGMWLLKHTVLDDLNLTEGDWNLSPQIKLNAMTNPCIRAIELPIRQYSRQGKSHQSYFKTGFLHAFWIAKNRMRTAVALPVVDEDPAAADYNKPESY